MDGPREIPNGGLFEQAEPDSDTQTSVQRRVLQCGNFLVRRSIQMDEHQIASLKGRSLREGVGLFLCFNVAFLQLGRIGEDCQTSVKRLKTFTPVGK